MNEYRSMMLTIMNLCGQLTATGIDLLPAAVDWSATHCY